MKKLMIFVASLSVFCGGSLVNSIDFRASFPLVFSQAQAYYGTGRRVSRRTARRTARRVSYRHNVYRPPVVAVGAVAATATAIAVGTRIAALPPSCSSLVANGITYYNCGGTYYQPVYDGPNLIYMVVQAP